MPRALCECELIKVDAYVVAGPAPSKPHSLLPSHGPSPSFFRPIRSPKTPNRVIAFQYCWIFKDSTGGRSSRFSFINIIVFFILL